MDEKKLVFEEVCNFRIDKVHKAIGGQFADDVLNGDLDLVVNLWTHVNVIFMEKVLTMVSNSDKTAVMLFSEASTKALKLFAKLMTCAECQKTNKCAEELLEAVNNEGEEKKELHLEFNPKDVEPVRTEDGLKLVAKYDDDVPETTANSEDTRALKDAVENSTFPRVSRDVPAGRPYSAFDVRRDVYNSETSGEATEESDGN